MQLPTTQNPNVITIVIIMCKLSEGVAPITPLISEPSPTERLIADLISDIIPNYAKGLRMLDHNSISEQRAEIVTK